VPTLTTDDLKSLIDFILELKSRQEAAESLLKQYQNDPKILEQARQSAYASLLSLPKASWIRFHLQQSNGRDLEDLVQVLRSRP